ncbi:hypothetical protein F3Y22_tig00111582pilonHSYRG00719 [Hibiscus syriacus]|uniref:Uncharacterized protein n=1 Tax=Hibiscus syriacus TaxID=106335 RepID=A0A6A2YGY3_HIBSY|nr:hypothetical protein F3Y22_tig00111582pilonHSYRG00719 [Hibiscus syriacus]
MDLENPLKHYCIATKFIDDKLLRTSNHMDGLNQVLLGWSVFQNAAGMLQGVGAKVPRNCLYLHIPLDSTDIQQTLRLKGFNGNRPSVWAIQGLPVMILERFEEVFLTSSTKEWMNNLFMSKSFKVDMVSYNDVARKLSMMKARRTEIQRVEEDGNKEGFEEH